MEHSLTLSSLFPPLSRLRSDPSSFEKINNDIAIELDPFTMENDLLTPTMKTKRNVAAKKYASQLTALYAAHPKKIAKL